MNEATVILIIPKVRAFLREQPVEKAWLFGSYSRGEETPESDVDLLVRYTEGSKISLLGISRMIVTLSKLIGRKVDLVEDGCLMPFAEKSVEKDKILIYERESY